MVLTKEEYLEYLKKQTIVNLIDEMARVKAELEEAKSVKTALQEQFDMIRLNVLPEKMEEDDITTLTLDGVGRVSLQSDIYFSIPAAHREGAYKWLRDNGHGDIIKETVNSGTGKAFAKEMMKQGEALPEEIFKVTPFTRAQLTAVK